MLLHLNKKLNTHKRLPLHNCTRPQCVLTQFHYNVLNFQTGEEKPSTYLKDKTSLYRKKYTEKNMSTATIK